MLGSTETEMDVRLCVPDTDTFRRHRDAVQPLAGAITHKGTGGTCIAGLPRFLESSINLLDFAFATEFGQISAQLDDSYASFSCDLGPNCHSWSLGESANGYPRYLPLGEVYALEELVDRAAENAALVRRHYGGTLKIENLNYFATGAYEIVCEPQAVADILIAADAELLLDIGHAIISAHNLGMAVDDYLDALPLERVSEVHLSRPGIMAEIWEDLHELPGETEFAALDRIAARAPLCYATMEYYRDDGYVAGQRLLRDWCVQWGQERLPR